MLMMKKDKQKLLSYCEVRRIFDGSKTTTESPTRRIDQEVMKQAGDMGRLMEDEDGGQVPLTDTRGDQFPNVVRPGGILTKCRGTSV